MTLRSPGQQCALNIHRFHLLAVETELLPSSSDGMLVQSCTSTEDRACGTFASD